jgi:hypothetical protein
MLQRTSLETLKMNLNIIFQKWNYWGGGECANYVLLDLVKISKILYHQYNVILTPVIFESPANLNP